MKTKALKPPINPFKPTKPIPPPEKIEVKPTPYFIKNNDILNLNEIFGHFKQNLPADYPLTFKEISFEMDCSVGSSYGNDYVESVSNFYFSPANPVIIDNPKHKEELAVYNRDLKKYEDAFKTYREQKVVYNDWVKQQEIKAAQAVLKKHKIA
jgi:hypothetical protein